MNKDLSDDKIRLATEQAGYLWPYARGRKLTKHAVIDLTAKLQCSRSSLFRYLAKLRDKQTVTALVPKNRGRKPLSSLITQQHEDVIASELKGHFLTRDRAGFDEVVRRIFVELQNRGLPPLSRNTIAARLNSISPREIVKRRKGARAAREQFELVKQRYTVERPLAVMQIDHTKLDVFAVCTMTNKVIGRPVLTICLDVFSRVVCGFQIGLEPPSAKVLMCAFSIAVRPKPALLEKLGIQAKWPVYGLPDAVHSDNGGDLTSNAFTSGLEEYGINHIRRPIGQPNWGGHVERFFHTINSVIHNLPGTTRSNVIDRGQRDPRKLACLTLPELRQLVASYICDVYHKTYHSSLGEPPLRRWERYWNQESEQPRLPQDMEMFERHFLPYETRKITRYGLRFKHLYYRSADLQKMRDCGMTSVRFKYDPDDVRQIYVGGNHGAFVTVPCEQHFHQSISFAEYAQLRDSADTNTNRWSDADLLRHYQMRDQIIGTAKRRHASKKRAGQGARVSSAGSMRPVALNWVTSGRNDHDV